MNDHIRQPARARARPRELLTLAHRWVGLVIAGFLVLAGVTGSLLAWLDELEVIVNPALHLVRPPHPQARPLDPLLLREMVARRYPEAATRAVWLAPRPGRSHVFFLAGARDPATGQARELANDQVFVDPYTGDVVGERRWGDISQGLKNLMPFIYRLHYSLALGRVGEYVLGIVALLWTLDCFVGAWLTLPPPRPRTMPRSSWLARWLPSWRLRWRAGGYRRLFDTHRAGGLWPWAMLFVLAWSSVAFNLAQVYHPVMRSLFDSQPDVYEQPAGPIRSEPPALGWAQARESGRRLMADQARRHGFTIDGEEWLSYDAARRLYRYDVRSSRDINAHIANTRLHFDADSGQLRALWLPTGAASADTIRTWLTTLHMAALWGWPMKLFVCLMGLLVSWLSVTGVVVWARKRAGRRQPAAQRAAPRVEDRLACADGVDARGRNL